jgi:hypothetical protein
MGAFLLAGFLGLVHTPRAEIINFESIAPNLFLGGESFAEAGFILRVGGDFGVVDTAAAFLFGQSPTGNPTRFYSGLNDSRLTLTHNAGLPFSLGGFDAAFIAAAPPGAAVRGGRLQASAVTDAGATVSGSWDLGLSSAAGSFAFAAYHSPADFAVFGSLRSLTFDACFYVAASCLNPYQNLGQFAIDNINVTAVPEPSVSALVALGLVGLAWGRRRGARPACRARAA